MASSTWQPPFLRPGYLGTFDLPGIAVLQAYNIPREWLPAILRAPFCSVVPGHRLGLYYMVREGINWSEAIKTRDVPVKE